MITKTDFDAKLSSLNRKITQNKTKHLLVENELKKLKTFGLSYFIGKSHFEADGTQNYLVFQPINRYFKTGSSDYVLSWKSKGLSAESTAPPSASNNFLKLSLNYLDSKIRVRFSGSFLKQGKFTYTHEKIVNIYIVYEINKNDNTSSDPTLENVSFGAVSFTKNANIDGYKHSGYGIGCGRQGSYSHPNGGTGINVINFEVDKSSSTKMNRRKI